MEFSYDDPNSFNLVFSNRLRLDDSAFQFSDLFNGSIENGLKSTFNSEKWSSWDRFSRSDVLEFINSALDASKNNLINAQNQNIYIDATGLHGRYMYDTVNKLYSDQQFWMIYNTLAFTRDNWKTSALALGEITFKTGEDAEGNDINQTAYGLVAT